MQQKFHVRNIENSNLLLANVFVVSRLDEILSHKNVLCKGWYILSMISKHSNVGKVNCRRTIEGCLVFKLIVT